MVMLGKRSSSIWRNMVDAELNREGQDHLVSHSPFQGVNALFISGGVSAKRLQVWKERVKGLGGFVAEPRESIKTRFTHVLANDHRFFKKDALAHKFKLSKKACVVKYEWIEDCLKEGKLLPCDPYQLRELPSPSSPCFGAADISRASHIRGPDFDENGHPLTSMDLNQDVGKVREACLMSDKPNSFIDVEANRQAVDFDLHELDAQPHSDNEDRCKMNAVDSLTSSDLPSVNKHITAVLREMWDIYESVLGDEWRALTYRKAAIRLERLTCRIATIEDVKHIPGIGNSMVEKIKEILCTGRLQKLDNLKTDPKVQTLQHLASVWGVGPKLAEKLYQSGHRTVEDLEKEPSLSQMARIGVIYYKDLALRIPRDEVVAAEKYVQGVAEDLCRGVPFTISGVLQHLKLGETS